MPKKPSRDLEKEKFWRRAFARQVASGLSQSEFCRREGLNPNTFSTWKSIVQERDADGTGVKLEQDISQVAEQRPAFIPINVASTEQRPSTGPLVVAELHPNGVVCILSGADAHTLRALLAVLRECKR